MCHKGNKGAGVARHIPDDPTTKSTFFPPLVCEADSHPPRVKRTLYFVTKSSAALGVGSAGLGGSDIAEGGDMG